MKLNTAMMLMALATAGQAAAKPLVIATDATYPPFEMVDSNGKLGGFEVDLAYALCAAMKTECEVINQPWDALLPGLQVRKYDAIMSSMNITDERRQKVDFSQVYYMMQNRFVGRSDKAADFADDPAHFKGKVIAVQEGTPRTTSSPPATVRWPRSSATSMPSPPCWICSPAAPTTPSATWCS